MDMEAMEAALWSLFESQKSQGLMPSMRQTLQKMDKAGFRDDRWFNAMGELSLAEKSFHQAARFFEQASKVKDKPEYRLNLGNAHYFAGNLAGARRILSDYLQENPNDAHARLNLVNCHLRSGEIDSATTQCEDALRLGLDPAPFWNALGQCHYLQERFEEAHRYFHKAYEAAPDSVDALFNRANASSKLGRLPQAIDDYALCTRKDENYLVAWKNRATACLEAGEMNEALKSVEAALLLNSDDPENHHLMARVRLGRQESDLARESLNRALTLKPEDVPSLLTMARLCMMAEEREVACTWAKRALLRAPLPKPEAIWALGLLVEAGDYETALNAFAGRSESATREGKAGLLYVVCLWKTGKIREAIGSLEGLLSDSGADSLDALTLLGILLEENGASELAEKRFRAALERQPGSSRISQLLAGLLIRQGRPGEALTVFQDSLAAHPEDPDLLYNYACVQTRVGNLDDALFSLRRAVEHGFDDSARVMDDPDLEPLRRMKDFAPLLT